MPTLNTAIQIGKSALRAQQIGLNVTGNNIANVNTPGYARKTADLSGAGASIHGVGSGVSVASLSRVRDQFLDSQYWFESSINGQLDVTNQAMSTVESIFTELAGGGTTDTTGVFNQASGAALSGAFNRFFTDFQDLANNPQSTSARAQVREDATYLTDQFHRLYDKLTSLRQDLDKEFQSTIDDVNRITSDIADLNKRILTTRNTPGDGAGNLEDQRSNLIDQLSKLMDVSVREETDGTVTISAAQGEGMQLVKGPASYDLGYRTVTRDGASVSILTQGKTGEAVDVRSGKLKGIMDVRDGKIVDYLSSLNELASTFVSRVNAVHGTGFGADGSTGNFFFDPALSNAREIRLSDAVANNLDKIAAAGPSATNSNISAGAGDGSVALSIAQLQQERSLNGGSKTVEEFYSDLVGRVGADAQTVIQDKQGQDLVIQQVSNQRENSRGVSIDEEASNLILFQRAYQAAARVVTAVDEMLQAALNM